MFEVGCEYNVVMLETGEDYEGKVKTFETSSIYECAEVDGYVVKFLSPIYDSAELIERLHPTVDRSELRDEIIVNTGSLFFVRAEKLAKKQ